MPAKRTEPRQAPLRAARWATLGSLTSAVLASACCWLPLLAVAVGGSAGAAGAFFEKARPWLLAGAAVLLGVAFWQLYLRKPACGPDGTCAAPAPRARRATRAALWVSALLVAAFALFPGYAAALLGGPGTPRTTPAAGSETVTLEIKGMTCAACAAEVRGELENIPGVRSAYVDVERGRAHVVVDPGTEPAPLLESVRQAGFEVSLVKEPRR